MGVTMGNLDEILQQCGTERQLSQGEVLIRQGTVSDGVYYLKSGRLGVYREEPDGPYLLTEIVPGETVGELGAATGRLRTATVKAAQRSCVIHVSEADFRRVLDEAPALMAEVIDTVGDRLTSADVGLVALDRSYQHAVDRVQTLHSEKERLQELLRLREELAAMIVHDLQNPLGVIRGGLELLSGAPIVESEVEYVDKVLATMERSLSRMQRLVDTLLDITRLEEGAMALYLRSLDLSALIQESVTEEHPLAESSGVTLENRTLEDIPSIVADRDVLQRVLINLLDNAIKYTPVGGQIWVQVQPDGGMVQVEVGDTGPGIPSEERARIFEKFTQVKRRAGPQRGVGLGLTFCQMAIEAHGGRIWVEDGPNGNGVRFVFALPQVPETAVN